MPDKYLTKECKIHGLTTWVYENRGYYRCKKCRSFQVAKRRKELKEIALNYKGSKCELCNYSACQDALVFHHIDPSQKEFGLGQNGLTRSLEKVLKEVEKCHLLCNRCHSEVHAGMHPELIKS